VYAYFVRGYAHSRLGHRDQAISDLKLVLSLTGDPDLKQRVQEELSRLGS